jgi:hypothetical protein
MDDFQVKKVVGITAPTKPLNMIKLFFKLEVFGSLDH